MKMLLLRKMCNSSNLFETYRKKMKAQKGIFNDKVTVCYA